LNASQLKSLGYTILRKQGGATALVPDSLNEDSPWSNLKVREAAEYAIDKDALAKAFGYGFWEPAYQLPAKVSMAYDPNFAGERKYDPAKAKQLLAEAGFPNGFKTKIIASASASHDVPVALQAYFNAVGIQTDIEFQDAAKLSQTTQGTWDNGVVLTSFIEYPNFNATLNFHFGPTTIFNKPMKKPDGWLDIFNATVTTPTPDKALMQKAARALYDDCTFINLYDGSSLYATTSKVHNVGIEERSSIYWNPEGVWLSK
jgi:peptide/nickel transport system substrate-binding protein